jgi:predicted AlkP superfamily phosphohydrolase/phosphomutase
MGLLATDKDTLLMVLSDHGFTTFRRGIDLNRWLEENGYLKVDDARRGEEHLTGVDWSQTRAFAWDEGYHLLGLAEHRMIKTPAPCG